MSKSPKISQDKWDSLASEQQEILSKLGLKPKPPIQHRTAKVFTPVEYYLEAKIYCQLCRSITYEYYFMSLLKRGDNNPFLHGERVIFDSSIEYAKAVYVRPTCGICKSRILTEWSKEEVVHKLITAWPAYMGKVVQKRMFNCFKPKEVKND